MVGNLLYKKWMVQIMSCSKRKTFSNFYTLFSKFQFFCQDVMKCEIFCQFTLKLAFRSNVGVQGSKCLTQKKEQPNIDKNIFYFQMIQQQNKVLDEQFLMHYACSNMLVSDLGKSPLHFACTLSNIQATLSPLAICFQPETTVLQLGCP